jgi:hypothetical protein
VTRRLKWPGAAAVVVSVVHVSKGASAPAILDNRQVRRISAYLVEGDLDDSPRLLAASDGRAFVGSYVLGVGFTFDDVAAAKGTASSLEEMRALLKENPRNHEKIFPYIGGEDINNNPRQEHSRYVIDFESMKEDQARSGWPELISILETFVKKERTKQKRQDLRDRWWQFAYRKNSLYAAIGRIRRMLAVSRISPMLSVCQISTRVVPADSMVIFAFPNLAPFSVIQSRVHEIWAWFFSSSMKDDLRYAPSDCFRTFPFPDNFETDSTLETAGEAYYAFPANLMIERKAGLTKAYNRFHARGENAPDIARLRTLHGEMDAAVLRAYGWNDLADRAAPEFIEQDADEGKTPKTRFDWPAEFKDEVLACLLALNAERAAAERAAGLSAAPEEDETELEEDGEAA